MADITDYPVLSQVTNEMASRLMVAGKKGLIMYLPEKEKIPKMNDSTNIFNKLVFKRKRESIAYMEAL